MKLGAAVSGRLSAIMEAEVRDTSRAIRRGVQDAGTKLRDELRQQVRAAGFRGGGAGLANSWRLATYPVDAGLVTLRPAALVYSKAGNTLRAHEAGGDVRVRRRRFMVWPTGFNSIGGRRNASTRGGVRVTPAQMVAAKGEAVLIPWKSGKGWLWCLRARKSSGGYVAKGSKLRVFVGARGDRVAVATGKGGGTTPGGARRLSRVGRVRRLLEQGFVPMYFAVKRTRLRKRLDIAGAANRASGYLAGSLAASLKG